LAKIRRTSEHDLIASFSRMIKAKKTPARGVVVGVGDDAAVFRPPSDQDCIITADALVEGRHFERKWLTGVELGWRLAAVNLSDIAAMGGEPLYAVLSLALPSNTDEDYVKGIERGVRDHLAEYKASIVGGNVTGIQDTIVCDLTLVGTCAKGRAWRRACRPGKDVIVVAGRLGEARAGLDILRTGKDGERHRRLVGAFKKPKPLLDVARLLKKERAIRGAIDVSDGFSSDLVNLCEAAKAGCEVFQTDIPLSKPLYRYATANGKVALDLALHGGEDYALILSVDAKKAPAVIARIEHSLKVPARVVGRFTADRGVYHLVGGRGRRMRIRRSGWDHLKSRI
jgi:thiamine-monophosphate kinase